MSGLSVTHNMAQCRRIAMRLLHGAMVALVGRRTGLADPQHRQIDRSGPTKPIIDLCAPLQMIEGKSRFLEQKAFPLPRAGAGAGHRIAASCKRRSRAQFRCCTTNTKPNQKAEAPSVTQAGTGAVYASLLRGKVERYEPTTHSATPVFKKHISSPDAG